MKITPGSISITKSLSVNITGELMKHEIEFSSEFVSEVSTLH